MKNFLLIALLLFQFGLPRYGITCEDTQVRGSPRYEARVLYDLPKDTRVRLRDRSRPTGEWVMIAPAHWIPLEVICGY